MSEAYGYAEQFKLVEDKQSTTLEINAGPLVKNDIEFHTEMWNNAIEMIKNLSEQKK